MNELTTFTTGAQRSADASGVRFDLIPAEALNRLAAIYKEGAEKFGDHNWRKGMPMSDVLNHAQRHLNMYLTGDGSEDHLAKVVWGMFALMEFEETEHNDLYRVRGESNA